MKQQVKHESGQQPSDITNRAPAGRQTSFVDNRSSAATQRKLANMIEQGTTAQRQQMKTISAGPAQRMRHEGEEPLQVKSAESAQAQFAERDTPKANNTGLPDQLKSGIENLSGMSMDHVKVHYNSAQPAQLNAHAYAQGSDIHVAPGQEQHLPHEAWHVVQQAQGRVKPTLQMKGGVPVNDDAGLERKADVMGERAAIGEGAVKQRAVAAGGAPESGVAQLHLTVGKRSARKVMTVDEVIDALWEQNYVVGTRERAVLEDLDTENESFPDGLQELRQHLEDAVSGPGELADDSAESPIDALVNASTAGDHEDPTAAWDNYMSRMLIDLVDSDQGIQPDDDSMQRVVSAVLLNHSHLASSLALSPLLGVGDRRQVSPLDREDPGVYYRSQDKGHPQVNLYKRAMAKLGKAKKSILAPHNQLAYDALGLGTATGSKAQKEINTRVEDGVTLRDGKHSEILSAHIGLRKSNAATMAIMVKALAANTPGGEDLVGFLAEVAREHRTPAPDAADVPPVDDDMLHVVLDRLIALNARLGDLSDPPGSQKDGLVSLGLGEDASTGAMSPTPSSPISVGTFAIDPLELATDPVMSTSHVLRKIGSALTRGHRMIAALPKLNQLRVASQAGSPQITVMVPRPHKAMTDKDYWTFTDSLRIFFGARVTVRAAENGLPLGIDQRQSFGFVDSSVTDTAASFRLSLGNEPPEFQQIINAALVDLDTEIGALFAKHSSDKARSAVMGIGKTASRPLQTVQAPDARHITYLKTAIASARGKFSLEDFLGYATGSTDVPDPRGVVAGSGKTKRNGIGGDMDRNEDTRRAYIESLSDALAAAVGAIDGTRRTVAVPTSGKGEDPFDYELPIVEPLSNAVHLAARVVSSAMEPDSFDPARWRNTRLAALGEMCVAVANANAALGGLVKLASLDPRKPDSGSLILRQRAVSHLTLRNATEELCEAIIIFLATTELHVGERPEDRIENALRSSLDLEQVDAFRMDNGEQAGTMAISALRKETGDQFLMQGYPTGMYFEYPDFVGENAVPFLNLDTKRRNKTAIAAKVTEPTATFVDPRPYLTDIDSKRTTSGKSMSQSAPIDAMKSELAAAVLAIKAKIAKSSPSKGASPHTIVVDLSNLDYMHPEVLMSIRAASPEVVKGLMRFVLINSGAKHEQQGQDKFQYGRAIVIGKTLKGLQDFDDSSLLDQFLGVMEDLRDDDAEELSDEAEAQWVENFAKVMPSYDLFMAAAGHKDAWAKLALAITTARDSTAEDRFATMQRLVTEGYSLIESELETLAAAFKEAKVPEEVQVKINLLPRADQELLRLRILRVTKGEATGGDPSSSGEFDRYDDEPSTRTGIANAGNTCYMSAGLSLLAFSTPYYNLFAPVLLELQPRAALRAAVRAILDNVRAGTLVERVAIRQLLGLMNGAQMLPRPSVADERRGLTATTAQQDPSEVIFRKLLDVFGTADVALDQVERTAFDVPGMVRAEDQTRRDRYSTVSAQAPVVSRPVRDGLIELSIAGRDTLQAALDAHFGAEDVQGVKAVVADETRIGAARRQLLPGNNGPRAITIALKRWQNLVKDARAIDVPEWLTIHGVPYRLKTVIHHEGASPTSGHYTASTYDNGHWQHRDDANVVAEDPGADDRRGNGYMFSFERVDALPGDAAPATIG